MIFNHMPADFAEPLPFRQYPQRSLTDFLWVTPTRELAGVVTLEVFEYPNHNRIKTLSGVLVQNG